MDSRQIVSFWQVYQLTVRQGNFIHHLAYLENKKLISSKVIEPSLFNYWSLAL